MGGNVYQSFILFIISFILVKVSTPIGIDIKDTKNWFMYAYIATVSPCDIFVL